MNWLNAPRDLDKHFIAVTAQVRAAEEMGFKHILPIWEWVGGRFFVMLATNLITHIAIGHQQFNELLAGAEGMDEHFLNAPFDKNLPILLA